MILYEHILEQNYLHFKRAASVFYNVVPEINRWMWQFVLQRNAFFQCQTPNILVPDIPSCQYDAVRTAVLQQSGIQNNLNKLKCRNCENKIF